MNPLKKLPTASTLTEPTVSPISTKESVHLILFTGTRIRIDSVMRPLSSSRERNTSASVTVTVTICGLYARKYRYTGAVYKLQIRLNCWIASYFTGYNCLEDQSSCMDEPTCTSARDHCFMRSLTLCRQCQMGGMLSCPANCALCSPGMEKHRLFRKSF